MISADFPLANRTRRILSIPLAKACLLFSSIVYERIDEFVVQATDIAKTDPEAAKALLVRSEAAIRAQVGLSALLLASEISDDSRNF